MKKKLVFLVAGIILICLFVGGCTDWKLPEIGNNQELPPLVKVEISFRDGNKLQGYMRGLRLGEDTTVFIGGQTTTNLYDADGNVTAIFNYAQVTFIKKITEE